ncbi:MAG: hypothetical protein AB1634_07645 [Thermodesulfobacteriota bacterium]
MNERRSPFGPWRQLLAACLTVAVVVGLAGTASALAPMPVTSFTAPWQTFINGNATVTPAGATVAITALGGSSTEGFGKIGNDYAGLPIIGATATVDTRDIGGDAHAGIRKVIGTVDSAMIQARIFVTSEAAGARKVVWKIRRLNPDSTSQDLASGIFGTMAEDLVGQDILLAFLQMGHEVWFIAMGHSAGNVPALVKYQPLLPSFVMTPGYYPVEIYGGAAPGTGNHLDVLFKGVAVLRK